MAPHGVAEHALQDVEKGSVARADIAAVVAALVNAVVAAYEEKCRELQPFAATRKHRGRC